MPVYAAGFVCIKSVQVGRSHLPNVHVHLDFEIRSKTLGFGSRKLLFVL